LANDIVWHDHKITRAERSVNKNQKPCLLWFTGLSGSGKSTIANALDVALHKRGYHTFLLDGDNVRHGLCSDLGFSDDDREENIRRVGEVCKLFADAGLIVMSAFISPFTSDRRMVRKLFPAGEFIEVYMIPLWPPAKSETQRVFIGKLGLAKSSISPGSTHLMRFLPTPSFGSTHRPCQWRSVLILSLPICLSGK